MHLYVHVQHMCDNEKNIRDRSNGHSTSLINERLPQITKMVRDLLHMRSIYTKKNPVVLIKYVSPYIFYLSL
jgi:hypothetical protein